jgi:hypothetical protein
MQLNKSTAIDPSAKTTTSSAGGVCCALQQKHAGDVRVGSFATGLGKLQVQPCPQWPESDGSLEKGALS